MLGGHPIVDINLGGRQTGYPLPSVARSILLRALPSALPSSPDAESTPLLEPPTAGIGGRFGPDDDVGEAEGALVGGGGDERGGGFGDLGGGGEDPGAGFFAMSGASSDTRPGAGGRPLLAAAPVSRRLRCVD